METQTQESSAAVSLSKGIDVGKLEKELAAMWQPVKSEDGAVAESGVTRVCVLNLIVYAAHTEDRTEIDRLLDEVTEQTPSRSLILVADREDSTSKLDAYVSTRCQVSSRGAKQVCGEQVTVEASGPVIETVASAIEPLLVPDVPVFLWWKDIPDYEDKLFNRLVEMSDRVVIDSLAFDKPQEDLIRLAEIIRSHPQFMRVSDLNWGRLTSWRMLIASFWDVPAYREHLDQIDHIVIEYGSPKLAPEEIAAQPLLVVGWLIFGLKWQISSIEGCREGKSCRFTTQTGENREIKIEMRAQESSKGVEGLIASLTLQSGTTGAEFYVAINQEGNRLETESKIGEARSVGRVLVYEQKTAGQRLSRELGLLARDEIYERTLDAAAQLLSVLNK